VPLSLDLQGINGKKMVFDGKGWSSTVCVCVCVCDLFVWGWELDTPTSATNHPLVTRQPTAFVPPSFFIQNPT
jgi:hypothetical protein